MSMTPSTRLQALAATLRANRCDVWAREADAIAFLVGRMERTLAEIESNAAEDADNAERAARLRVAPIRPRLRLVGAPDWCGPVDGVQ